jgi:hypothetical protein
MRSFLIGCGKNYWHVIGRQRSQEARFRSQVTAIGDEYEGLS